MKSVLTEEDRDKLAESSAERGRQVWLTESRKVLRPAAESAALDEFCLWLDSYEFDVFFSVTYSDKLAALQGVRSVKSARSNVLGHLAKFGYRGRLGLNVEMTDREIPHVHGVLHAGAEQGRLLGVDSPRQGALWRYFFHECGRCRFELIRDQSEATLYALKDTFKESKGPEGLYLRLRPQVGYRSDTRGRLRPQDGIYAALRAKRRRARSVVSES